MFRFVDPTNFLNLNPDLTDSGSSTINVLDQTVTLPLNLYHRLLNQHCKNDDMDDFFMYIYKVKLCSKKRAHDWTECPFAHRGEKAKRRDPRKFPYQGIICPVFKSEGECNRGANCEFSHGIFEFWLHPSRFRTRLCESGLLCPRRVCFFAHSAEQLRPTIICSPSSHAMPEQGVFSSVPVSVQPGVVNANANYGKSTNAAAEMMLVNPASSSNVTEQLMLNAPAAASSSKGNDNDDLKDMYEDFVHFDWVMDVCNFEN